MIAVNKSYGTRLAQHTGRAASRGQRVVAVAEVDDEDADAQRH